MDTLLHSLIGPGRTSPVPPLERRLQAKLPAPQSSIAATKEDNGVSPNVGCLLLENKTPNRKENAMNDFIAKYQDQLNGTLSGFDRLVFSGTPWKDRFTGMKGYLSAHGLAAN